MSVAERMPPDPTELPLSFVCSHCGRRFGSTAQFIVTWLLDFTGNPMAIAWYLVGSSLVSTVALLYMRPPEAAEALA